MSNPNEFFDRWFVVPLSTLESIPNGDGGIIALATSCFLYERYAIARIKNSGQKANRSSLIEQFSIDFTTNEETAKAFWDVIRDGILHQGMPKQRNEGKRDLPGYVFHESFTVPVELVVFGKEEILKIQPWLLISRVLDLCQAEIELLAKNNSFPFPKIM